MNKIEAISWSSISSFGSNSKMDEGSSDKISGEEKGEGMKEMKEGGEGK